MQLLKELRTHIARSKAIAHDYNICFVVNIDYQTRIATDYNDFSISSEFLNQDEAERIYNALLMNGYDVMLFSDEIDFIRHILSQGEQEKKQAVINLAQNGTAIGRKSLIPAFCDLLEIQRTGSNAYVVSLCRDKYRSSKILAAGNLPTPQSWLYDFQKGWLGDSPNGFVNRIIVKPNYESSSIGIGEENIGYYDSKFQEKIEHIARKFKQAVIVEEFISGYEVEIPIICLDNVSILSAFPVGIARQGNTMLGDQILSYDIRSKDDYDFYNFNDIDKALSRELVTMAKQAYSLLGIQGFGRIDCRVNREGQPFITDVCTSPHITSQTSYSYVFESLGFSYEQMVVCQLSQLIAT